MQRNGPDYEKIYDDLMDELIEDMLSMSDEEILAEVEEEGINIDETVAEVKEIFQRASRYVARARMREAIEGVLKQEKSRKVTSKIVDIKTAKKKLEWFEQNKESLSEVTLAARNLKDLSEEEIKEMYLALEELGMFDSFNDEE
jgi:proline dehydrogenase